jgi:hypothetical protein
MTTCQICHFTVEMDDVELRRGESGCICVACYYRETDSTVRMSNLLRRELIEAVSFGDGGAPVSTDRHYREGNHPG